MSNNNVSSTNTQLLADICSIINDARTQVQKTVNSAMVNAYWQIGQRIVRHEQQGQERAAYGTQQLEQLATQLTQEFGKGFEVTNLRRMRQFYLAFPIRGTVSRELSWSHYYQLIRVQNPTARTWYMEECVAQNWSVRALDRQISTLYYERLLSSQDKEPVKQEADEKTKPLQTDIRDYLRDPCILEFLNLPHQLVVEKKLEQGLINNLQKFLLELGKGFAFVARQQRITAEHQDFYIDLVFYNYQIKCFLLVDLKMGALTHQDVGQMDMYVRMYDEMRRGHDDNPTIGLILCSEKNATIAKYSVLSESKQLFASKYLTYLPSEEELRLELQRERNQIMEEHAIYNNNAFHITYMQETCQ